MEKMYPAQSVSFRKAKGYHAIVIPARVLFSFYLPKRLTKSPTEKEPQMPPTEKMETAMDQMAVREFLVMGSW